MIAWLAVCAAALTQSSNPDPLPTIELIAVGHISTFTRADRRRVGGLSGLAFHKGRWLAITDDKEDAPRLYELTIRVDPRARAIDASISNVLSLDAQDLTDAEAVAFADDALYVAFERPCAVAAFRLENPSPHQSNALTVLRRFTTPEPVASMSRKNRAFESVLVRPTHPTPEIWAFTESATNADGPEASTTQGAVSRAVVWPHDRPDRSRQFAYVTLPKPPHTLAILPSYNSLVDAVALDAERLLTLERSFSVGAGYDAAIRRVTIKGDESELSAVHSLVPRPPGLTPLHTDTVATLQALGAPSTANYEAMALGPPIDDARAGRLLIILADDNFGADGQPSNVILALRWIDAPASPASEPTPEAAR